METFAKIIGFVMIGITAVVFFGLVFSLPVMWLWNTCLIPAIPGLQPIGWLQAWGISILSGLLISEKKSTSSSPNS